MTGALVAGTQVARASRARASGTAATGPVADGDDPSQETMATEGRVLVVEDDEQLLSALERHLSEEGFIVETAREGHEALVPWP
jgi:PleD family two-component response regulator